MAKTLHYNFKANPSLSAVTGPTLDITRTTSATMVDADGYIREVQSGEARFDGATFAHNLLQRSETLENAYWTKTNVTASDSSDSVGGVSLTEITDDATNSVHAVQLLNGVNPDHTLIFSAHVKKGTARYVAMSLRVSLSANVSVFDTQTGSWTTQNASYDTHYVEDLGGGAYRIAIIYSQNNSAFNDAVIGFSQDSGGTVSYSGSGDTLLIGGLMVEEDPTSSKTTPSDYIATTTSAVTSLSGSNNGLLVEEARTQLATWTEDASNAAWTKSNVSVDSDSVTAPDGSSNSNVRLRATAANGTVLQSITSSSADRSYAVYLKRVVGTGDIDLTIDGGTTWQSITVTDTSWQRYDIQQSSVTDPEFGIRIVTSGDEIDFWGSQLENGDFPTSYIENNSATASVTRNEDVVNVSDVSFLKDGVGSIYVSYGNQPVTTHDFGGPFAIADSGSGNDVIRVFHRTLSDGAPQMQVFDGGTTTASVAVLTGDHLGTGTVQMAAAYEENDFIIYADGDLGQTDTSGTIPAKSDLDQIMVGDAPGGLPLNGTIQEIRYYDERLTDAQLEDMSNGIFPASFAFIEDLASDLVSDLVRDMVV